MLVLGNFSNYLKTHNKLANLHASDTVKQARTSVIQEAHGP